MRFFTICGTIPGPLPLRVIWTQLFLYTLWLHFSNCIHFGYAPNNHSNMCQLLFKRHTDIQVPSSSSDRQTWRQRATHKVTAVQDLRSCPMGRLWVGLDKEWHFEAKQKDWSDPPAWVSSRLSTPHTPLCPSLFSTLCLHHTLLYFVHLFFFCSRHHRHVFFLIHLFTSPFACMRLHMPFFLIPAFSAANSLLLYGHAVLSAGAMSLGNCHHWTEEVVWMEDVERWWMRELE